VVQEVELQDHLQQQVQEIHLQLVLLKDFQVEYPPLQVEVITVQEEVEQQQQEVQVQEV
tara:strand:+ start:170 stop:346 length:177 start_codon:yes stop_codon:yes gene_type:complete